MVKPGLQFKSLSSVLRAVSSVYAGLKTSVIVDILSLGYIVNKMIGLRKEGMGVDAESHP